MPVIILSHKVADYGTWRPFYDADTTRRAKAGLEEVICGQRADDPHAVYMVFKVKNLDGINEMFADPELAKIMEKAGVISKPEMLVIE